MYLCIWMILQKKVHACLLYTSNIVAAHGIRLALTGENGEYVTPTGAAIVAAVRTSDKLPESFVMEKIGLGGGKREYKRPGILRAILIREEEKEQEKIWKPVSYTHLICEAGMDNYPQYSVRILQQTCKNQ